MDVAALIIAAAALVTSIIVATRQHRLARKAVSIDERLLAVEETRFSWEAEERDRDRRAAEEEARLQRSARFDIRFEYRDWGRHLGEVIAHNSGPSEARDVQLTVGAETGSREVAIAPVRGMDHGSATFVPQGQALRVGIAFSMGSPTVENLTYRLEWTDGLGTHHDQGPVPLP